METKVKSVDVPVESEISEKLSGAHYFDSYQVPIEHKDRSALQIYLDTVAETPRWINRLMATRNNVVSALGLKNLGHLGAVEATKSTVEYHVGDRVGIFTLLSISDREVILGDSDKHLDVRVSVYKDSNKTESVVISTVVHIHNLLGRMYMLFVTPVHKLIVPAMLVRAGAS